MKRAGENTRIKASHLVPLVVKGQVYEYCVPSEPEDIEKMLRMAEESLPRLKKRVDVAAFQHSLAEAEYKHAKEQHERLTAQINRLREAHTEAMKLNEVLKRAAQ